jgi:hypothetical protein
VRGRCDIRPSADGLPCDDGNACTTGDSCQGGVCDGLPKDCDDGIACTTDWCSPESGECQHAGDCCISIQECDDKDPCTGDICDPDTNKCLYESAECDDHDACTEDWCEPFEGCRFERRAGCPRACATAADCDDGSYCTDDFCDLPDRVCVHSKTSCSDGDLCTQDFCEPKSGCQFRAIPGCEHCDGDSDCPLHPENLCIKAVCNLEEGRCEYSETDCDDGDPCTADYCVPETGECWWDPVCCATDADCDPDNACSAGKCEAGLCKLMPIPCDDGDPCTEDSCDTDVGCVHEKVADCQPGRR